VLGHQVEYPFCWKIGATSCRVRSHTLKWGIAVKKHAFLAPLAASVAVLLANTALPAHATIEATNSVATPEKSSAPTADLVLTRSAAGNIRTVDHYSHASHESHSSHSSHTSGS
jgi:hypothetical protein